MKNFYERMKWFNEARFGMFIHWGLYSIPARGEWVMLLERIAPEECAKLSEKFNPTKFNPDSWAKLAKEAGMRYMVLTTRHHDGFCLFDSKVSDFTSVKAAAKRDFVASYVKACRKFGLKVGFYYSLLDWRFPGYFNREKDPQSFKAMVDQVHGQVKELMTNYGKIDYLFYDGEWIPGVEIKRTLTEQGESSETARLWRSKELNAMVRRLQPGIIINNRSGLPEDVDTPEQYVIASKEGRGWESCMTIGDSHGWGYIKNSPNLKTIPQLIQYLITAASGGGNYLLNVGPKPDGTIQSEFATILKEIGKWMRVNSESVYGSERIPAGFGTGILGMATAKGNTAYFHVFRWPGEVATISGIKNNVLSAKILGTTRKIRFEKKDNGLLVLKGLPKNPPDKYDTVIKVELKGKPETFSYEGISL